MRGIYFFTFCRKAEIITFNGKKKKNLGAGESGKSTVLKQMRLIHAAGFSSSEKEAYRIVVFDNIVSSMQSMLEAMEILRIEMKNPQNLVSYSTC
jgi:hypothetical protein